MCAQISFSSSTKFHKIEIGNQNFIELKHVEYHTTHYIKIETVLVFSELVNDFLLQLCFLSVCFALVGTQHTELRQTLVAHRWSEPTFYDTYCTERPFLLSTVQVAAGKVDAMNISLHTAGNNLVCDVAFGFAHNTMAALPQWNCQFRASVWLMKLFYVCVSVCLMFWVALSPFRCFVPLPMKYYQRNYIRNFVIIQSFNLPVTAPSISVAG